MNNATIIFTTIGFLLIIIGVILEKYIKNDDWIIFSINSGDWNVMLTEMGNVIQKYFVHKQAIYIIYFSKKRKKYKLKISGHKPKQHKEYINSLNQLIQLNQKLLK